MQKYSLIPEIQTSMKVKELVFTSFSKSVFQSFADGTNGTDLVYVIHSYISLSGKNKTGSWVRIPSIVSIPLNLGGVGWKFSNFSRKRYFHFLKKIVRTKSF